MNDTALSPQEKFADLNPDEQIGWDTALNAYIQELQEDMAYSGTLFADLPGLRKALGIAIRMRDQS